jgi:hypothetical protein
MIDFQARINNHARKAAKETVSLAIHFLNQDFIWQYDTGLQGDQVYVIVYHSAMSIDELELCYTFDLAGRTIDAALLEQLHNEVTVWFTAIKEGASA